METIPQTSHWTQLANIQQEMLQYSSLDTWGYMNHKGKKFIISNFNVFHQTLYGEKPQDLEPCTFGIKMTTNCPESVLNF